MKVLTQDSPYWEKCARHATPYTARAISYFFLCDTCHDRLVAEAFNGRPPIYHGEHMQGFCGLCNELTDVRFRQWFLCPPCYSVVASYQKAFVSARTLETFWRDNIAHKVPTFELEDTDAVRLTPFVRRAKTKRNAAQEANFADYLVSERVDDRLIPRCHIELKTGPGSIEDMSEFQLDVNDYNDIAGPVANTGLPAYIFHVQTGMEYLPPTRRSVARNLWWTDLQRLHSHIKCSGSADSGLFGVHG